MLEDISRERAADERKDGRVRTDKVTILEVEAVQLVASLLRVHDILVDDKGSALGVVGDALADLAGEARVSCFAGREQASSARDTRHTGLGQTSRKAQRAPQWRR